MTGYALEPPTEPDLFSMAGLEGRMESVIGDIRDLEKLKKTFEAAQPEIVFHLAAQPIVRDSYKDPVYTYETNVHGNGSYYGMRPAVSLRPLAFECDDG